MTDEIILESPIDCHVHLRQEDMMCAVVPHTAATFAAVLVMPNTVPPITSAALLNRYRNVIEIEMVGLNCRPLMSVYFGEWLTRENLERLQPRITAVKFYGAGLTTNAHYGCSPDDRYVPRVLEDMEDLGMTLCVHPEAPGYHEDRERLFGYTVRAWARDYPRLKIVLEHISGADSVDLLDLENVYATVTPHHLLLSGDDWVGPPLRPHLYCMPVAKRPRDRDRLVAIVTDPTQGLINKVMLGTDSAPHPVGAKEAAECCAGIFHAPIALQLVAGVFDKAGSLARMQAFCSDNARRIHGIAPPKKTVRLVRKPFMVPGRYGDVVPMYANQTLDWSVGV